MSDCQDELLRPLTAEQKARLTSKRRAMRGHLRRRAVIQKSMGGLLFVAEIGVLAAKAFVIH